MQYKHISKHTKGLNVNGGVGEKMVGDRYSTYPWVTSEARDIHIGPDNNHSLNCSFLFEGKKKIAQDKNHFPAHQWPFSFIIKTTRLWFLKLTSLPSDWCSCGKEITINIV